MNVLAGIIFAVVAIVIIRNNLRVIKRISEGTTPTIKETLVAVSKTFVAAMCIIVAVLCLFS